MDIQVEQARNGSHMVRLFYTGDVGGPFEFCCVFEPLGDGRVRVSLAHGDMTPEGNILLGLKAYELGYKHLDFYVEKGSKVTRWAKPAGTDLHWDYYTVDLEEAVTKYFTEKAL